MSDWGPPHPTWDGTETRNHDGINKRAASAMVAFYLGRGFMETPTWEEIGDDERYGWRSVIRAFDRGEIPGGPTDPPRGAPAPQKTTGGAYDTREERDMDLGNKIDRLTKE